MDTFTLTADIVNVPVGIQKGPINVTNVRSHAARVNNIFLATP